MVTIEVGHERTTLTADHIRGQQRSVFAQWRAEMGTRVMHLLLLLFAAGVCGWRGGAVASRVVDGLTFVVVVVVVVVLTSGRVGGRSVVAGLVWRQRGRRAHAERERLVVVLGLVQRVVRLLMLLVVVGICCVFVEGQVGGRLAVQHIAAAIRCDCLPIVVVDMIYCCRRFERRHVVHCVGGGRGERIKHLLWLDNWRRLAASSERRSRVLVVVVVVVVVV